VLLARDLPQLSQLAADRVHAHLSTLGEGAEAWVAKGMQLAGSLTGQSGDEGSAACPFCAQQLSGSEIISHYKAYFGDAYEALKGALGQTIDELDRFHGGDAQAAFERAIRTLLQRGQFWSRFDVPPIDLQTDDIARGPTPETKFGSHSLISK
jgi:hypothetical protein